MARQASQRGPQTQRYERRYGADGVPEPGGVNTHVGYNDPTAIPPHQFMQLINIDWDGNDIVSRGGAEKVNTDSPLHAPNAKLHAVNFDLGAPKRVWIIGDGLPEEGTTGIYLGNYDPEQCPRLQREIWYRDAAVGASVICSYDGAPHAVIGNRLVRLNIGKRGFGQEGIDVNGEEANIPIGEFTADSVAHSAIEFDGKLFIAIDDDGNGEIWVWDGLTLQRDKDFTSDIPLALGLYADTMLVGFSVDSNMISIRPMGDPGATYVDTPPDTGTVATSAGNDTIKSYQGIAYGVGDEDPWSWDGTTLTGAVHSPGALVTCLTVAFGHLIYANDVFLGTFDGAVWTDHVKDLSGDLPDIDGEVLGLVAYRGSVVAAARATGSVLHLLISPVLFADFADDYEDLAYGGVFEGDARYLEVI